MQFLQGITILLLFQLLGEITACWLHLPIPGPVLGMGYLFLTLLLYKRTPATLETAATALLSHLSLLFIPAGVGMILYFEALRQEWIPIVLTLLLSTVTAALVIATGIIGAIMGTRLFAVLGIRDERIMGVAMGVTAHGIGTSRAFQVSAQMGAFSGLAMALSCPPWSVLRYCLG